MTKELDYDNVDWGDYFYYDQNVSSGLCWKVDRYGGEYYKILIATKGQAAGRRTTKDHCKVYVSSLGNKGYYVHRIIMCLHGHKVNGMHVDHINGNKLDNRYENMRVVSSTVNHRNKKQYNTNKTGVTGVHYDKSRDRYVAQWTGLDGKGRSKMFTVAKHGKEGAFKLACEYRIKILEEMNEQGAGYSKRHLSH